MATYLIVVTVDENDWDSKKLGEVAGAAIGEALKANTTLTSINLGSNKLDEVAGAAIGDALKVNTTLTSIELYEIAGLDAENLAAIEATVAENKGRGSK